MWAILVIHSNSNSNSNSASNNNSDSNSASNNNSNSNNDTSNSNTDSIWLRANGHNTNGAAGKIVSVDGLGKKVRPGIFGKLNVG